MMIDNVDLSKLSSAAAAGGASKDFDNAGKLAGSAADEASKEFNAEVRAQFVERDTGNPVLASTSKATIIRCLRCAKESTFGSLQKMRVHIAGRKIGLTMVKACSNADEDLKERVLKFIADSEAGYISSKRKTKDDASLGGQQSNAVKPISELTKAEVLLLMKSLGLDNFITAVKANDVDGFTLSFAQTEMDLVEIGVSLHIKARMFLTKILTYKESGVPISLIRPSRKAKAVKQLMDKHEKLSSTDGAFPSSSALLSSSSSSSLVYADSSHNSNHIDGQGMDSSSGDHLLISIIGNDVDHEESEGGHGASKKQKIGNPKSTV